MVNDGISNPNAERDVKHAITDINKSIETYTPAIQSEYFDDMTVIQDIKIGSVFEWSRIRSERIQRALKEEQLKEKAKRKAKKKKEEEELEKKGFGKTHPYKFLY